MLEYKDDCKGCKFAGVCGNRDWYSWGQIRFCRVQMIWLIKNLAILADEGWPENPAGSSYVDPSLTSKSFRDEAYFVKPSGMAGEVFSRLRRTGRDGKILRNQIRAGDNWIDLEPEAKTALNYISGYRRRKESYRSWRSRLKPT